MVFSCAETIPLVNSPLLGKSPPAQTVTYKETKITSNIKLKCTLYIKMCLLISLGGMGGGGGRHFKYFLHVLHVHCRLSSYTYLESLLYRYGKQLIGR